MKYVLSVVLCFLSQRAFAQNRPNVDTLSLGGIRPSVPSVSVPSLSTFDTILWNDGQGIGMLRSKGSMFGHQGEFRVAIQNNKVEQVSFAAASHNRSENDKLFSDICSSVKNNYGTPDIASASEIRWEGVEQFFAIRTSSENDAVTVVLSRFDKK
ncbi:MAG TPA: hypothetical protein VEW28_11130 [Candidatus Kapabacteria bacterium]|nr:hypothetical protein [Candidatus Kapabacteria bacterium]